jgi:hypothetical protein
MFVPLPILALLILLLVVGWLFFIDCNREFWKLAEESRKFANAVEKWYEENEGTDD